MVIRPCRFIGGVTAVLGAGAVACAAIVGADFDDPEIARVDVDGATDAIDAIDRSHPGADGAADAGALEASAPSCAELPHGCGPGRDDDCCASTPVPGGTFLRSYDGQTYPDDTAPATIRGFRLDRYEITVGRFRRFVAGYPANRPSPKTGFNTNNRFDPGWDPAWTELLPADADALLDSVRCNGTSWTDAPAGGETKAMNCLSWFVAFAFCIWDGGRLPTEAEWNFAAAGGDEQRVFPWSSPPGDGAIDESHAVYTVASAPGVREVGSKPLGFGRWAHADLAGNVSEWVVDWFNGAYLVPCSDCARLDGGASRGFRGGSFRDSASGLLVAMRGSTFPGQRTDQRGARCARNP